MTERGPELDYNLTTAENQIIKCSSQPDQPVSSVHVNFSSFKNMMVSQVLLLISFEVGS